MSFKYKNVICEHCRKELGENDDVVICPVCGTPCHRECYLEHGGCPHESEHAEGYVWKSPNADEQVNDDNTKVCTRCGARNRPDAVSCQLCGAPFDLGFQRERIHESEYGDTEFDVDGVSSKEIAAYLGTSSRGFMPKFRALLQNGGGFRTWNLPAFFLGPFYFFYRRINKVGLILLAILAAVYVPNIIYTLEFFKAYYMPQVFGVTVEYSQQILKIFGPMATVSDVIRMALHVYCCVQANKFFLDRVLYDIKDMQVKFPAGERNQGYFQALSYRGKPAAMRAAIILLGMFALLYIAISVLLIPIMANVPV